MVIYNHTNTIALGHYFRPPYETNVLDEYVLFDFLGLVSSVGGTLGIFIGFSIFSIVSCCFNFIFSWIENCTLCKDNCHQNGRKLLEPIRLET